MSEFRSMYEALKGWYCEPLEKYPVDLRKWVEAEFHSPLNYVIMKKPYRRLVRSGDDLHFQESSRMVKERRKATWDDLTPARRLGYAKKWDFKHDPATKAQRDEIEKFYGDYDELECEIAYWENANAPTVLDMAKRDEILAPLKARFAAMDLKRRQMLGDPDADDEAATIAQTEGEPDEKQAVDDKETEADTDAVLAALFDPVTPAALEKMFPADGKWNTWHAKAKEKGLDVARDGKGKYSPYRAALWWLAKQAPQGWDLARCHRVLKNNLPGRSRGSESLLTGEIE